jgi:hypothetical protein
MVVPNTPEAQQEGWIRNVVYPEVFTELAQ